MGKKRPKLCLIDIESTSLDADVGVFVGGGLMTLGGRFKWVYADSPKSESKAIKSFLKELVGCDVVVTWNGRFFDIPFITARALRHGVSIDSLLNPLHLDLAEFVKNNLKLARHDLYHVSRFLGIRKDLEVEGFDVPALYAKALKGDRRAASAIRNHCRDDLETTRLVFLKLLPLLKIKYPDLNL